MEKKNPAAVSLGRMGGKARVKNQTPEQRKASARNAAKARWDKLEEISDSIVAGTAELAKINRANAKKAKKKKTPKP
jgi:hypothetical protein